MSAPKICDEHSNHNICRSVLTTGLSHLPAFYIAKDWYRGYMVEEINLYIE